MPWGQSPDDDNTDCRKFARGELRRKHRQRIIVRHRLSVWVQRLNADMAGPSVEMGLDALTDCHLASPGDHCVQKSITAAAFQILVAKT